MSRLWMFILLVGKLGVVLVGEAFRKRNCNQTYRRFHSQLNIVIMHYIYGFVVILPAFIILIRDGRVLVSLYRVMGSLIIMTEVFLFVYTCKILAIREEILKKYYPDEIQNTN
jgi:hypothetical protein